MTAVETAALAIVLAAVAAAQRRIEYRSRWPSRLRRAVWPAAGSLSDRVIGRSWTRKKDDDEYVCSVECSTLELQKALWASGYRHNLVSTLKWIAIVAGRRAIERGSWAFRDSLRAKWMHHCYFFDAAEDGYTFHLNHHKEINYLHSPKGHENGPRHAGDPNGTLQEALDDAGIEYDVLEQPKYGA